MRGTALAVAEKAGKCQFEGAGHSKGAALKDCTSCQWWLTSAHPKAVKVRGSAEAAKAISAERGIKLDGKLFLAKFAQDDAARKDRREAERAIEGEMVVDSDEMAEFRQFQLYRQMMAAQGK